MSFNAVLTFIGGGTLVALCWMNATRRMIREIGTNSKLFPKHYSSPPSSIRKIFRIKKDKIPKFLLYMCYVTIVYFFLGPIELLLYMCTNENISFASWTLFIHCLFVITNALVFLLLSAVYKK